MAGYTIKRVLYIYVYKYISVPRSFTHSENILNLWFRSVVARLYYNIASVSK